DGPRATRIAISTIAGVSIMVPLIALVLHFQAQLSGSGNIGDVPLPSLRINTASVLTTICDLVFLAMAWEFFGKRHLKMPLWLRSFLTLLGVMWLDVLLFNTGAFLGTEKYLSIMTGTFVSRFFVTLVAFPLLYLYLFWQTRKSGVHIENRPVLAILKEVSEIRDALSTARREIELRKEAEAKTDAVIAQLQQALAEVKTLRGYLPTCANCNKIRDDRGEWVQFEQYIQERSEATFSHSICPECRQKLYPR
ncbi:MAG: VUT family protein, partial [Candidatus Sumerlaeota bacterium]